MLIHHLTIIETTDLVEAFEQSLGSVIGPEDQLEFFKQLFQILDGQTPEDLINREVLVFESFVFANHLTLDTATVDRVAHGILTHLWKRVHQHNFYINGVLMYFPYRMHGKDLCVRRYSS